MKLTNAQVKAALDCMGVLCGENNRLPVVAALKADRTLRALSAAWEPCEAIRKQLVQDHGEDHEGGKRVMPGMAGWPAFVEAYNEMAAQEADVAVEPITVADVEKGYSRDPETGKKDALDISPAHLGALVEIGIIEEKGE